MNKRHDEVLVVVVAVNRRWIGSDCICTSGWKDGIMTFIYVCVAVQMNPCMTLQWNCSLAQTHSSPGTLYETYSYQGRETYRWRCIVPMSRFTLRQLLITRLLYSTQPAGLLLACVNEYSFAQGETRRLFNRVVTSQQMSDVNSETYPLVAYTVLQSILQNVLNRFNHDDNLCCRALQLRWL